MSNEVSSSRIEHALSKLDPENQERLRQWIADGTFIERALGVMWEQEVALAEQPAKQEPVEWLPSAEWTACVKLPVTVHVRQQRPGETHVSTREGITPVKPDDLIMRGVSGEEYPIGREIFERTYRLGEAPQPAIPPGYKLVPLIPTPEMKERSQRAMLWVGWDAAYAELLDAAPTPPAQQDAQGKSRWATSRPSTHRSVRNSVRY